MYIFIRCFAIYLKTIKEIFAKMNFKNRLLSATFLILITNFFPVSAEFFFSGESGIQTEFNDSEMNLRAFMEAQLNLTENLFLRTEFSIVAEDVLDGGIFEDSAGLFKFSEASLNYQIPTGSKTHFLTVFAGNVDPVGSDRYLRHMFGISKITSPLMESFVGSDGGKIYGFDGYGAGYSVRFAAFPIALGAYLYKHDFYDDDKDKTYAEPNFDFRMATASKYFTLDMAFGAGFPLQDKDDTDAFIYIDYINLHAGATVLVGNSGTNSLLVQAGFSDLKYRSVGDIADVSTEDLFLIFEPRIKLPAGGASLTLFNIPEDRIFSEKTILDYFDSEGNEMELVFGYNNYTFIEETLGVALTAYNDTFSLFGKNIRLGMCGMMSFKENSGKDNPDTELEHMKYLDDLKKFPKLLGDYSVIKLSPFVSAELLGGNLSATLQIRVTEFKDDKGKAVKFTLGYKKTL